ncbi:MAG: hypothetical protein ACKVRP_05415 [Bacteroidota bacterium]
MKHYDRCRPLSDTENEMHLMVLFEELDMQTWFSISASDMLGGEVIVSLQ